MRTPRESPREFTDAEDARILAMIADGIAYREIANALGRALSSTGNRGRFLLGKTSSEEQARRRREARKASGEKVLAAEKRVIAKDECRCLGGCGKTFRSPDPLRIRICPLCKQRHASGGYHAMPDNYALCL